MPACLTHSGSQDADHDADERPHQGEDHSVLDDLRGARHVALDDNVVEERKDDDSRPVIQ